MTVDPSEAASAEPRPDEDALHWSKATDEVRAVAKWVIGGLAAVATVIFGAGPIVTRPELSWSVDAGQLAVAGIAGIIGLAAIISLIMLVAGMLVPRRVSLHDLPRHLRSEIDHNAASWLPTLDGEPTTFRMFLENLPDYTNAPAEVEHHLAQIERQIDRMPEDLTPEAAAQLAALRAQRDAQEDALPLVEADAAIYRKAADRILDVARFEGVSMRFARARSPMYALAGAAAVGALVFQLALSDAPDEEAAESASASASASGSVAYLLEAAADSPGGLLWAQLGLDACASGPAGQRHVPVIVGEGGGTTDDPYEVTTLRVGEATSTCEIQRFRVLPDVLTLQLPEAESITIEYTPAPSPPPSSTTTGCDALLGVPVGPCETTSPG